MREITFDYIISVIKKLNFEVNIMCCKVTYSDMLVSLTGSLLIKPLSDSSDKAIEKSRFRAIPYAAGIFLLGTTFSLVEFIPDKYCAA